MRTVLEQGGVRLLFADELAIGIIRADVGVWRFCRSESEVTLADVEAVKLPLIVNGRRLFKNSQRALIIKAIIALLKKIPSHVLSVILAQGLFYSCRRGGVVGWSMSDCYDLEEQGNNDIG
jgi:hypothetical protein